jgi:hypothetical protein
MEVSDQLYAPFDLALKERVNGTNRVGPKSVWTRWRWNEYTKKRVNKSYSWVRKNSGWKAIHKLWLTKLTKNGLSSVKENSG